jgi:hypothetical protein
VLAKLVLACFEFQKDTNKIDETLSAIGFLFNLDELIEFIGLAERGLVEEDESQVYQSLSIAAVIRIIETLCSESSRKRCVVLFDDAALTLTQDYMVELFDIIRSIKTKQISPKASVYPGTTEYGPRFHVGHDADEVICWMNVQDSTYSDFMDSLVSKRFSDSIRDVPDSIVEILKYASFGIPRAFISLIRDYLKADGSQQSKYNSAIEKREEFIKTEYLSLSGRLPQYKKVIEVGDAFFDNAVVLLTAANNSILSGKQLVLGIEESSIAEHRLLPRMIQFLNEAGLMYSLGRVSHGVGRSYQRYMVHMVFLLRNRAFSGASRGFNTTTILETIKSKSEKHPLRKTMVQILGEENLEGLKLDFPVCASCSIARLTEEQLFCHNCGSELVKKSTFEECLKIPVDDIGLTEWQKQKMKNNSFTCIEDFVSKKDPASALREIRLIGPKKAERISKNVEKFIAEYLS